MHDDKDSERQADESKEQYIARLKARLKELFEQHSSNRQIMPPNDQQQLVQWNARHEILKRLKEVGERAREEIDDNDDLGECTDAFALELRQRWLTPDGKIFRDKIIRGLSRKEYRWNPALGPDQTVPRFSFDDITSAASNNRFSDFYYVHTIRTIERDLRGVALAHQNLDCAYMPLMRFEYANLMLASFNGAVLSGSDFSSAIMQGADLRRAQLSPTNFQEANLEKAYLHDAYLMYADFQGAHLAEAHMQRANLQLTKLQGACFRATDLRGAQLDMAVISGTVLKGNAPMKGEIELRTSDQSADFTGVKYSREWHGPLWAAFCFSLIGWGILCVPNSMAKRLFTSAKRYSWQETRSLLIPIFGWFITALLVKVLSWMAQYLSQERDWKKFAWERKHKIREWWRQEKLNTPAFLGKMAAWCRKISKGGRPTVFLGVDTSGLDASKNPGLKRDIDDEQFIADFKAKRPKTYWLWAMSSNCGRSIPLWIFWCAVAILFFSLLYAVFPLSMLNGRTCGVEQDFGTALHTSVLTFATFGFGDSNPAPGWGKVIEAAEVVCGYIFFGGLVALFTSTLTRRA